MLQPSKLNETFEKADKIGQGSYGTVYKVRRKGTQEIVALKRVKLGCNNTGFDDGIPSSSLREIAALNNLKHPNIVKLIEIHHTGTSLYLVLEYLDKDLKRILEETTCGIPEREAKSYLLQLLKGISFCHSRRIIHRDLKLQNLLVSRDGVIKLADFGLARNISLPLRMYTKEVVTLWYRAPELLLGAPYYGPAIDLWSLGCIFYEMLTKKALFPGQSEIDQLFKIFQVLGTPTKTQWTDIFTLAHYQTSFPQWPPKDVRDLLPDHQEEATDLLDKFLIYDPFKRITAQDAMRHPYFEDLNKKRHSLKDIQDPSNFKRFRITANQLYETK